MSTAEHARRVLELVDADLGLVDPTGLRGRCAQSYGASLASFAQRDTDEVVTSDLDVWLRQRMVDLCGTDSYEAAVLEVPQTRTLLAFSLLACSQNQDIPLPQVDPGMPVPPVLQALEPDFFPVFLGQVNDKFNTTPAFAEALQASTAALDQLVAENVQASPGDGGPESMVAAGVVFFVVVAAAALALIIFAGGEWSKRW